MKCDVIGIYYPFWWKITSGGKSGEYQKTTSIIELNAASGEVYIKDTHETVLGSAGHALNLKINHLNDDEIRTDNLKVILVEEDSSCYDHLRKVIRRRWSDISIDESEGSPRANTSNIYLLNDSLDEALEKIDNIELGNAIYYFDPLRSVKWEAIERVAKKRMPKFFQTGTEFIIFLFTSDWFLGRDDFAALPTHMRESSWTEEEKASVLEADTLFGNQSWRRFILANKPVDLKAKILVDMYKLTLYKWFRYVLPMPFNPKENQFFHLILCSNYEAGITRTKGAYTSKTLNRPYKPSNENAYERFIKLHPETLTNLGRRRKPLEWLLLWKVIKNHEGGVCDCYCRDFSENELDIRKIQLTLEWLKSKEYLVPLGIENAWKVPLNRYILNWKFLKDNLGVDAPSKLKPLSPEEFAEVEMQKLREVLEIWKKMTTSGKKSEEE